MTCCNIVSLTMQNAEIIDIIANSETPVVYDRDI